MKEIFLCKNPWLSLAPAVLLILSGFCPFKTLAQTLFDEISDAVRRLEKVFHTDRWMQEASSGVVPMPDWVQQTVGGGITEPEWNLGEQLVESQEAKTFWDDAVLEAGGFLSPGKLTFDEAEKLGLAPEDGAPTPYRVFN